MYYEGIEHTLKEVANAEEAANLLKGKNKPSSLEVLTWTTDKGEVMAICNDMDINNPAFFESAVFKKVEGKYYQVESITVGWCDLKETVRHFVGAEIESIENKKPVQLIIGEANDKHRSGFTCGCCGTWFIDFIKVQKVYGQDQGFGICLKCKKYYPQK